MGTGDKPIGLEHLFYYPKYANVTVRLGLWVVAGVGFRVGSIERAHTALQNTSCCIRFCCVSCRMRWAALSLATHLSQKTSTLSSAGTATASLSRCVLAFELFIHTRS